MLYSLPTTGHGKGDWDQIAHEHVQETQSQGKRPANYFIPLGILGATKLEN